MCGGVLGGLLGTPSSHLLVVTLCSFLLVVILLFCVLYLVYKRVCHRATSSVNNNLTAVIITSSLPSPCDDDLSSKLRDLTSGYSGSSSGISVFLLSPRAGSGVVRIL